MLYKFVFFFSKYEFKTAAVGFRLYLVPHVLIPISDASLEKAGITSTSLILVEESNEDCMLFLNKLGVKIMPKHARHIHNSYNYIIVYTVRAQYAPYS